jgi:hypothetical protein
MTRRPSIALNIFALALGASIAAGAASAETGGSVAPAPVRAVGGVNDGGPTRATRYATSDARAMGACWRAWRRGAGDVVFVADASCRRLRTASPPSDA